MLKKARFNLDLPNAIKTPCRLDDLFAWLRSEIGHLDSEVVRGVIERIADNIDVFVRWPMRALQLWPTFVRAKKLYPKYPPAIKALAKQRAVALDSRVNGPAIAAYQLAGGKRPERYGSKNAWTIHHLYSGKFPYIGKVSSLRAAVSANHCSQSAGLVAVHPLADQLGDEVPAFAWLLRAEAFRRFGYDPDGVFTDAPHDEYGFVMGQSHEVYPVGIVADDGTLSS